MPFVDVSRFGKGSTRAMLIALVIIGILIAAFVLLSITSRRSLDMDEFYGFLD
jgi:hypothetical protein